MEKTQRQESHGYFLTHHVIQITYGLILVALSSALTAFFLTKFYLPIANKQFFMDMSSGGSLANVSILPNLQPGDDFYIERGSPYDNRAVSASESASVVFHGPRDKKKIALTFDAEMTDGMKANVLTKRVPGSYDKRIVDILNQTQTKATFFLTGMWIELYPQVTRELSSNPLFELGSHSYTDSSYSGFCYGLKQLSDTLKIEDIGATEKLLRENAGVDNRLFRFPGGCYTPNDVKLVNQANDIVVHWDVSGNDGFNNNTNLIVRNVVDNVKNGSIIILHLNGVPTAPNTANALPTIISSLKGQGYEFVKVNELLGLPPEPKTSN